MENQLQSTGNDKLCITVMLGINAIYYFKEKNSSKGTATRAQKKGWMTKDLTEDWLTVI